MPVDLENLAEGYEHRPTSAAGLARARLAAESVGLGSGDIAVDIGGGRGNHAAVWLEFGAQPVVVDPSVGMAAAAAQHNDVAVMMAVSQRLPLRDDSVRLAYFHLSLHYGDWKEALDEVARVVGDGGECWIWTMGEEHHRASILAKWFPSIGDIDAERFPDPAEVCSYLSQTWSKVETKKDVEPKVSTAARWRNAVEAGFVSTLQLISDEEMSRGLAAYDVAHPDPDELVEYVLTYDRIRAIR